MLVPGYSGSEYLLDTLVCFDDWHWHWDTAAFSVTKLQLNHWACVCNMLWFFHLFPYGQTYSERIRCYSMSFWCYVNRPGLKAREISKLLSIFLSFIQILIPTTVPSRLTGKIKLYFVYCYQAVISSLLKFHNSVFSRGSIVIAMNFHQ